MPKPKAIYLVGGPGSGKSTFMGALTRSLGVDFGEVEVVHSKAKTNGAVVVVKCQSFSSDLGPGMYLGVNRENFPGTDAIDKAAEPAAVEWMTGLNLLGDAPPILLGEGARLGTPGFFTQVVESYDLLVIHMTLPDEERLRRLIERGNPQKPSYVKGVTTRGRNVAQKARELGAQVVEVDNSLDGVTDYLLTTCEDFLRGDLDD